MVSLQALRASNAGLVRVKPGLVGVFVGGTSGIGESTLKEFCHCVPKPSIYIVGRNEQSGSRILSELREIDKSGTYNFIQKDVSLLSNVDDVCMEIREKEKEINLLFLSCGVASMKGRNPTSEGIDKKLATNYYSRMRFVQQLMPLLKQAHPSLSRVVSVLAPGTESLSFDEKDPGLEKNYSMASAAIHAPVMTDFFFELAAKEWPAVSFVHSYPGFIKTGFMKETPFLIRVATSVATKIMNPWITTLHESGERHLYLSTHGRFPSKHESAAMPGTNKEALMKGSDGEAGSGAYLVGEDCEFKAKEAVLEDMRRRNFGDLIWNHTMQEFLRVRQS